MEFDWLDCPLDLHRISPKEVEESFEDPFSIRLMPEAADGGAHARYYNLGKSAGDRGVFTVFWTDGKRYRAIAVRDMVPEEVSFYDRRNSDASF